MTSFVAELGTTHDPKALVPGDPDAVRTEIALCNRYAAALVRAGDGLKTLDTGDWKGEAADAFHDAFDGHPVEWIKAGDAFLDAAEALTVYVETLEWAQRRAVTEAISLWDEAEVTTNHARVEHAAAVEQQRQRAATATPGQPFDPASIPFVDPGAEKRAAAQDMLHRARMQLIEAGDRASSKVTDLQHAAPAKPGFWSRMGTGVAELGAGVGDWAGDLVDLVTHLGDIPANVTQAMAHPVEFGKNLISWDQFHTNPARAAGHVAPDVALAFVGGAGLAKKGGSVLKGVRAGLEAAKSERILAKATYNGKTAAEHVADEGADIGRTPRRPKKQPIRLVDNVQQLDEVYRGLSRGGTPIERPGYKEVVMLPDGSTVGYRLKPDLGVDGNTIDVRDPANRPLKIHIDPPKGN